MSHHHWHRGATRSKLSRHVSPNRCTLWVLRQDRVILLLASFTRLHAVPKSSDLETPRTRSSGGRVFAAFDSMLYAGICERERPRRPRDTSRSLVCCRGPQCTDGKHLGPAPQLPDAAAVSAQGDRVGGPHAPPRRGVHSCGQLPQSRAGTTVVVSSCSRPPASMRESPESRCASASVARQPRRGVRPKRLARGWKSYRHGGGAPSGSCEQLQ